MVPNEPGESPKTPDPRLGEGSIHLALGALYLIGTHEAKIIAGLTLVVLGVVTLVMARWGR